MCIAEQPANMLTKTVRVNVNDDHLKKVWLEHMTDRFQDEGHGHLHLTVLECDLYLDHQTSDDVAMRLLNGFTREVLGCDSGTFVMQKPKNVVRTSPSVLCNN